MSTTYMQKASTFFNIKVLGAFPATYADITPRFKINSNTVPNVELYKTYLGVKVGTGDELNYGIYDKSLTCNTLNSP